ncbi:MAG: HD domain-containing protein [Erysipelotrichaceae bacterium]|nr:HD domain-containing protein [Erysipelotrichaceae bacterium]
MLTYEEIIKDEEIKEYISKGNEYLGLLGYTDHSEVHTKTVAKRAEYILKELGYDDKTIELTMIASYMHDIGNVINRKTHAEYGALLANELLKERDLTNSERVQVISAISHHDETTGGAVDPISAALIIADKTDVRRNRVREKIMSAFDIHDRVNYAVTSTKLEVDSVNKKITLYMDVDEEICTMFEYFEIFLGRMMMCRESSKLLGCEFSLVSNGSKIL